jgi:putative heme transporter
MASPTQPSTLDVPPPGAAQADPAARPSRPVRIGQGITWTARWSGRWLLIAALAVVLGLAASQLWVILLPIILALLLASVLAPGARLLEHRLRFPAALAAATMLLGGLGALVGIGFAIAPSVSGQSAEIVEQARAGLQRVQDWIQAQEFVSRDQVDAGLQAVQDRLGDSGSAIASGVLTGVGSATSATVTTVITLILTFLFLKDGRRFRPFVARMAGGEAGEHLSEVLGRSWATLGGYIRTQAIVSAVDAVLIGIALLLVGVPLAIPLAILTFIGGFIPIVGAFVVGGLAVLVALVTQGPTSALIILAVIIGVQQLEGNVLSPWLQSRSMQLQPAVVLLAVTLGSTLFGITGAFLAVPVAAVAAVVLRYLDEVLDDQSVDPVHEPEDDVPVEDDQAPSVS